MISANALYADIKNAAVAANLDPSKFGAPHRQIVERIADFLNNPPPPPTRTRLFRRGLPAHPPAPIIICGIPGTGKTTFISVIDAVLRTKYALPDNITPEMRRDNDTYAVTKRYFEDQPLTLLSVSKWRELLHFYEWDKRRHKFVPRDLSRFLYETIAPMRIVFADEVEMVGYSPTLPTLAKHGLLVIGTSNQEQFRQLESAGVAPETFEFGGEDMRAGDPTLAVVSEEDTAWGLFDWVQERGVGADFGRLPHHYLRHRNTVLVHTDFKRAVNAPFLETEWTFFLQSTFQKTCETDEFLRPGTPYILLLENFSLETLATNYNAVIRYVALFDALEQIGIGVLVRNQNAPPTLSKTALEAMKHTIETTPGVSETIRTRTLIGIDRSTSRLGKAGSLARNWLRANGD